MTKDLKPCPECARDEFGVHWTKNVAPDLSYTYGIICRWCGYFMTGSTVRVLTAGSKAAAWRRTKAKWNKIDRQAT